MSFQLSKKITIDASVMNAPNLCDRFDTEDLGKIGDLVYEGYFADQNSRSAWLRRNEAGMNFALQVQKDKNWPWQGCSNVIFPLITIAALQFSSRAYANIISGPDVVRCRVVGEDPTGGLTTRAERISTHMSWQCLEEDTSWEEQHDRLFINEAIVGTSFIKSYYSGELGHNVGELVLAKDLVLDYYATSVEACARKTHIKPLSRNQFHERILRGIFRDVREEAWYKTDSPPTSVSAPMTSSQAQQDNRKGLSPPPPDRDTPFECLEQHRLLDLDQDGYAEPYIVTIEATSRQVVRIVARWDREIQVERTSSGEIIVIRPTEYFTKYGFIPSPDGGVYDIGFGVLLGPLNEAVNTSINQLLDAGTMQNSLGGFLGRGAKIRGGEYSMAPWEWKRVDSTGDDLRKNIVPYPDRQPSTVLFNLLGLLIDYTNRVASTTEQMVGKTPGQNTPAETSRNALEQGMQVFSTIFKRIWRSMKEEFKKLHQLNAVHLPISFSFGQGNSARREDYLTNADLVVPTADPNITSLSQRFFQAQSIREASQQVPGYDVAYVERNFLRAMRVEAIDKFFPGPDKVPPPPNPKIAVAEMQLKMKQLQLQDSKLQWMATLMEQKRLNGAKIIQLQAQAAQAMADVDATVATTRLEYLQMALTALQQHNQMISERITALGSVGTGGEPGAEGNEGGEMTGGNANVPAISDLGGGVPGMEGGPDDQGGIPADAAMAGGAEGAME
jgi:chaperonin GroES